MLTNASPPFGRGCEENRPPPFSAVRRISDLRREEISRHRSAIGLIRDAVHVRGRREIS
jgi:hypothetical protein